MVAVSGASIIGIIISLLVIFFLIFNIVYVNGYRSAQNTPAGSSLTLSSTGATIIFWADIILVVILIFYVIYNFWRIFTTPEQRSFVTQTLTTPQTNTGGLPITVTTR